MYDLTGFQRDLLTVTAGIEEPHGLAIKDELEDYYEKEIHHGRLYPNLDTLVEKGLVEKERKTAVPTSTPSPREGSEKSKHAANGKTSTSTYNLYWAISSQPQSGHFSDSFSKVFPQCLHSYKSLSAGFRNCFTSCSRDELIVGGRLFGIRDTLSRLPPLLIGFRTGSGCAVKVSLHCRTGKRRDASVPEQPYEFITFLESRGGKGLGACD